MGAIPKRQAVSNQRGLATGRYFVAAFAVWGEIWGLATALAATLKLPGFVKAKLEPKWNRQQFFAPHLGEVSSHTCSNRLVNQEVQKQRGDADNSLCAIRVSSNNPYPVWLNFRRYSLTRNGYLQRRDQGKIILSTSTFVRQSYLQHDQTKLRCGFEIPFFRTGSGILQSPLVLIHCFGITPGFCGRLVTVIMSDVSPTRLYLGNLPRTGMLAPLFSVTLNPPLWPRACDVCWILWSGCDNAFFVAASSFPHLVPRLWSKLTRSVFSPSHQARY